MTMCDPQVASIADAVYGVWAKYRLQVTGASPVFQATFVHISIFTDINVLQYYLILYRPTTTRRSFGGKEEKGMHMPASINDASFRSRTPFYLSTAFIVE